MIYILEVKVSKYITDLLCDVPVVILKVAGYMFFVSFDAFPSILWKLLSQYFGLVIQHGVSQRTFSISDLEEIDRLYLPIDRDYLL